MTQQFTDSSSDSANPFIRFRELSWAYHLARSEGVTDEQYQNVIHQIDRNLTVVDGAGFTTTPFTAEDTLAQRVGGGCRVWVKDETQQVSGCFKSRHLMGVATHLAATELARGCEIPTSLALASCGNAAVAAATVATAVHRELGDWGMNRV